MATKQNPPLISFGGVPKEMTLTIRSAFNFTDRVKVSIDDNVLVPYDIVGLSVGLIIFCDDIEPYRGYLAGARGEIGPGSPITWMTRVEPSEEAKAFCTAHKITRIAVYPNPDALEFVAEAFYLIATHKFRNTNTGDIV